MRALVDTAAAGWPLSASLGTVVIAQALGRGRRRSALNRALHELRRPLQALALSLPGSQLAGVRAAPGSLELALAALDSLDREVNGITSRPQRGPVRCRELVEAAVLRSRHQATNSGTRLRTRWMGGAAVVVGDRLALAAALDNLLANAIAHGGPEVTIAASVRCGRLRMAVVDDGKLDDGPRVALPGLLRARVTGRRDHGHGLGVVRSVAADHGGRFALQRSREGSVAMLELPLARAGSGLRGA